MAFAENLRRLRLEQFLTQAELARRADLHALTVTRLEAGTTAPSARTVRALAEALGVEPRQLADPGEVAELRRVIARADRPDGATGHRVDRWDDDGGAAPAEDGRHANQA